MVKSSKRSQAILAVGADSKNCSCLGRGHKVAFGPQLGDLGTAQNYDRFVKSINAITKKFAPQIVACDGHPGYFSSQFAARYALEHKKKFLTVQHHHAHLASVVREHGLNRPVLGVAFDGTGWGSDGKIWGGEFLSIDGGKMERLAHLKYFKMPGGEQAIREPWRMAVSIMGKSAYRFLPAIPQKTKAWVSQMLARDINAPLTSSIGRLFDAAAALLGLCQYAEYEAQGPMQLTALCDEREEGTYDFDILRDNSCLILDPLPVFSGLARDLGKKRPLPFIAMKFHNTVAAMAVQTIQRLVKKTGVRDIVYSGGVFQNHILKRKLWEAIKPPLRLFGNANTPVNDLNIALGQYHVSCYSS